MRKVLPLIAAILLSPSLFAFAGADGEGKPTSLVIQQFPSWNKVPIVITAAKVKGQELEAGVPFNAGDDWIRHLSVVVKNVSGVDLAGVAVTVEFARSAEDEPLLPNLEISAGKDYVSVRNHSGKDLGLKAGDSVELSVGESWYAALEYELKHRDGLPSGILRRATVTPLMASFSRDRVWLRGNYMMRDTENPNRWLPEPTE